MFFQNLILSQEGLEVDGENTVLKACGGLDLGKAFDNELVGNIIEELRAINLDGPVLSLKQNTAAKVFNSVERCCSSRFSCRIVKCVFFSVTLSRSPATWTGS